MSADILSDPDHPHGTVEGFQRGCRSTACPAPVACRTVHTRYAGDYSFRRAIDSGMSPVEVVRQESERVASASARILGKKTARRQYVRRVPGTANSPHQKAIKELLDQGLTDGEIAVKLGKTRDQICASRNFMKLPPNSKAPASSGVSSS